MNATVQDDVQEFGDNKIDLVKLQDNLNKEFDKSVGNIESNFHAENELGMSFIHEDDVLGEPIRLFFSLSKLRYILSTAKYDKLYLGHSWMRGFTHFRGENFSVIDLQTLFNPKKLMIDDIETRLILFKEYENMRVALLGREISLINLDKQYFGISIMQEEPETQLLIDEKLCDILKKSNNSNLSFLALEIKQSENQPNYLNLAHVQKYSKIYNYYFKDVEKIRLYKDYSRRIEGFNILYFASSFFIDEMGILGVEIDIDRFTKYLYHTN